VLRADHDGLTLRDLHGLTLLREGRLRRKSAQSEDRGGRQRFQDIRAFHRMTPPCCTKTQPLSASRHDFGPFFVIPRGGHPRRGSVERHGRVPVIRRLARPAPSGSAGTGHWATMPCVHSADGWVCRDRIRTANRTGRDRGDERIQPPPNTRAGSETDPPPAPSAANRLKVLLSGRLRSRVTHCQRWSHPGRRARQSFLLEKQRDAPHGGNSPGTKYERVRATCPDSLSGCATNRASNFRSPCGDRSDRLRPVKHLTE
jgi:hypothetical protein